MSQQCDLLPYDGDCQRALKKIAQLESELGRAKTLLAELYSNTLRFHMNSITNPNNRSTRDAITESIALIDASKLLNE